MGEIYVLRFHNVLDLTWGKVREEGVGIIKINKKFNTQEFLGY